MYHNITSFKWSIMRMFASYIGFTSCLVKWYFPGVPQQIPLCNMYIFSLPNTLNPPLHHTHPCQHQSQPMVLTPNISQHKKSQNKPSSSISTFQGGLLKRNHHGAQQVPDPSTTDAFILEVQRGLDGSRLKFDLEDWTDR